MRDRKIILTAAALAALVFSCSLDRDNPAAPSNPNPNPTPAAVVIPVGVTKALPQFGLEITFDTVFNDSRCPSGAMCFWAGMATVRLEVAASDTDRQAVVFQIDATRPAPDSSRYVVTSAGKFRIDLRYLAPYPDVDVPYSYWEYRVGLAVSPYQADAPVIGAVVPSRLPVSFLRGDAYAIDSLRIIGRKISMDVTYSGGCRKHQFTLFMNPPMFAESNPPQAFLYLYHNADNDFCRALITERLTFDLQPLLDLYGGDGDPIRLNVHSQPGNDWVEAGQLLYEPPEFQVPSILPLAIGNYWIYADTVWNSGIPTGSIDTVEVIGRETDSLGEWWLLSNRLLTLGDRIMLKGDSIYTLQHGWLGDYVEREYIPAIDTEFTYEMILQGDLLYSRSVYIATLTIVTPVGTFVEPWGYECFFFCNEPLHQFIEPGIGFVHSHQHPCGTGPTATLARQTWLIEYHLEE